MAKPTIFPPHSTHCHCNHCSPSPSEPFGEWMKVRDQVKKFQGELKETESKFQTGVNELEQEFTTVKQDVQTIKEKADSIEFINAEEVNEKIGEVSEQLADTAKQIKETSIPENYNGAIAVFIDDDAKSEVLSKFKPILDAKGIKISIAAITNLIGATGYLTKNQLMDLQTQGHDIVSHTHNHVDLNTATNAVRDSELKTSMEWLRNNGFKGYNTIVYPWGLNSADENTKNIARKYYDYGVTWSSTHNITPFDNFWVQRVDIGNKTLAQLKSEVDGAFSNKSLIVFLSHAYNADGDINSTNGTFSIEKVTQLIDYIKSKSMPIMTFSEAVKYKGNVIAAGEYSQYDRSIYISRDGKVKFPENAIITSGLGMDSSIGNYKWKKFTINQLNSSQDTFLKKGGTELIYRGDSNFSWKLFFPYDSNDMYKRRWVESSGSWSDWNKIGKTSRSEQITLTVEDIGTLTANSVKQIQKALTNITIDTSKYIVQVTPVSGIPPTLAWSYGVNSGANSVQINLVNPRTSDTTPSGGIAFEVTLADK